MIRFIFTVRWFIAGIIALMFLFIFKFYVVDLVKVNAGDMSGTFEKGDVLLIKRVLNRFEVGDVLYIEIPLKDSSRTYTFQRLFGLPGDSVSIIDKQVFINGFGLTDTSTVKHNYYLKTRRKPDSLFYVSNGLTEGGRISGEQDHSFTLNRQQAGSLRTTTATVESIQLKREQKGGFDGTVFPYSTFFNWNRDHFGKLYIPKKGDKLRLDSLTLLLYAGLIRDHEKNELEQRNDSVFINDEHVSSYEVKQNYYFLLGDNRDNANDSRIYGLLPEKNIRGRYIAVIRTSGGVKR